MAGQLGRYRGGLATSPRPPGHGAEPPPGGKKTVVNCYDFFDRIFPECGLLDLTDGMYCGDPTLSLERAQENQINWLLDQVGCVEGSRILDIGCGYGTLLAAAERRGAMAVGITLSTPQARRCVRNGLDARVMDYREIDGRWHGSFDAIVANGSIEHFVQPQDAIAGKADAIYRGLFETCSQLLDRRSPSGRVATTVIHLHRYHPDPQDLVRHPLTFMPFSEGFHSAILERCMGGFYPNEGQLERCAGPHFQLVTEVDGTEDYRLTSEEWLDRTRRSFVERRTAPRIFARLLPFVVRHPLHSLFGLSMLLTASWQWQFRDENPRTRLLRHVWKRRSGPVRRT
jgi:cyclopropane-fatty-acyl-phospholipid synthase